MTKVVTVAMFDQALEYVKNGVADFYVNTIYSSMKINAKNIKAFEKVGACLIAKSSDGKGFLVQSGKRKDFVFPGYLVVVAK